MQEGIRIVEAVPAGIAQGSGELTNDEAVSPSVGIVVRAVLVLCWSALLFVVAGVRVIAGHFLRQGLRLYVYLFVQASAKAKCPACGIRAAHDVRWNPEAQQLVHLCKRCFAAWMEQPMVKADVWSSKITVLNEDGSVTEPDGTRTTTVQHAQRLPQLVKQVKMTGHDKPVVIQITGKTGGDVA